MSPVRLLGRAFAAAAPSLAAVARGATVAAVAAVAPRPRSPPPPSPSSRGRRAPTCSVMSAPVAWSTTRMDSFTLPRSSKPMTFTFTASPTLTTSVVLLTRSFASSEMWTRPSLAPRKFTKAPNSAVFTTLPL